MGRKATGSVYWPGGVPHLSITLDKRRSFRLGACRTHEEANVRKAVIVDIATRLKRAGQLDLAVNFCRQAGEADEQTLARLVVLMDGVLKGNEHPSPPSLPRSASMTVKEFGETLWTNNELARRFQGRVRNIDHTENIRRMKVHVYPVIFKGRSIGDTPLDEFTLDHAEYVLAQEKLPRGSLRHVAQCLHRLFKLAVFPARMIVQTPFPPGWLPAPKERRARAFLYPSEDAQLMACTKVPLVVRLFLGFSAREGVRRSNVVNLRWTDLVLDGLADGGGSAVIDRSKNGSDVYWALDPGTAEALRRWRRICPSRIWVFPAAALPGHRAKRENLPLRVDHIAGKLRDGLKEAGVTRSKLFQNDDKRMHIQAHDLRATFVTLALAGGKTEDWVRIRTGHCSSNMIAKYRRDADTVKELKLGWLQPLHLVLPELAELGDVQVPTSRPKLRVIMGGK